MEALRDRVIGGLAGSPGRARRQVLATSRQTAAPGCLAIAARRAGASGADG
jgi:hypothetical protein